GGPHPLREPRHGRHRRLARRRRDAGAGRHRVRGLRAVDGAARGGRDPPRRSGYWSSWPALTSIVVPVIPDARSEARKITALATSSSLAIRRSAMSWTLRASTSS